MMSIHRQRRRGTRGHQGGRRGIARVNGTLRKQGQSSPGCLPAWGTASRLSWHMASIGARGLLRNQVNQVGEDNKWIIYSLVHTCLRTCAK
jgi:hypothetical protein